MAPQRLLLSLLSLTCWAAEGPWAETFTLPIAGDERTMVVHDSSTWLLIQPADIGNIPLLTGRKEVVLETKCARELQDGNRVRMSLGSYPGWIAEGPSEVWATAIDIDNLYLYGILESRDGETPRLTVTHVEPAPSDAQVIAKHLKDIATRDWNARLKAAEWVRSQSTHQPNKEFWLSSSDGVIGQVIDDAALAAGETRDLLLLDQAITWSVEMLHDIPRAGRIASAPWIKSTPGATADALSRRLRRLGLEMYRDLWRPRAEALTLEFEDRFLAIGWKDADAFYRLGRWADTNGEFLPQAKDRTYRCYQAGFKADPNHQGIRNELGLPNTVHGDGTRVEESGDFIHHATGVTVPIPQGWKRGDRLAGDITWIDPTSETAYISASIINTPDSDILDATWATVTAPLTAREGFSMVNQEDLNFAQGGARRMHYRFKEGKYIRQGEVLLAVHAGAHLGVRLDASFADEEADNVRRLMMIAFGRMVIPDQAPSEAAPATGH